MTFSDLIRDLGQQIGLSFDGEVASPVEIRVDALAVTLAYEERGGAPSLALSCALGVVPEAAELGAYRVMLDANVMWMGTADATLGVNADTREGFLCFRVPMDGRNGENLAETLEGFVYVAGNWANFVESLSAERDAVPPAMDTVFLRA